MRLDVTSDTSSLSGSSASSATSTHSHVPPVGHAERSAQPCDQSMSGSVGETARATLNSPALAPTGLMCSVTYPPPALVRRVQLAGSHSTVVQALRVPVAHKP